MLSETNRLDSYSSMKAKILSTYFGKLDDYSSQTSEMEEDRTVMDLTYSTNSGGNGHQRDEDDERRTPSQSYASPQDDASTNSVLRVLPQHHHSLLSLPPGPSNYRTVIQHIPTTMSTSPHHSSGMITVLPESHQHHPQHQVTSVSGGPPPNLSRHQPSPIGSVHSLESHPSASSSPSLNSECYKSTTGGNYSGSEAGGSGSVVSSSRKKKKQPQPIPEECKDDAYWERRKRNNESAKRSREIRRMKEHHTSIRVVFLEQENLQLRTEVNMLREEVEKLRNLLCSKGSS